MEKQQMNTVPAAEPPKNRKWLTPLICIGAGALLVALVAYSLFGRTTDLTMRRIVEPNYLSVLLTYGAPNDIEEDGDWEYSNGQIQFYGIDVDGVLIDFEEASYTFVEVDDDDQSDIWQAIRKYCDYEDNSQGIFYYYSYGDMAITVNDSGSYTKIEFH